MASIFHSGYLQIKNSENEELQTNDLRTCYNSLLYLIKISSFHPHMNQSVGILPPFCILFFFHYRQNNNNLMQFICFPVSNLHTIVLFFILDLMHNSILFEHDNMVQYVKYLEAGQNRPGSRDSHRSLQLQ